MTRKFSDKRRKKETRKAFMRRLDQTRHKLVKDGGPTTRDLLDAIAMATSKDPNFDPRGW